MQYIKFNNDPKKYKLIRNILISENTVEIHFEGFNGLNESGFVLYSDDMVSADFSNYTTRWNVLTELPDGVVYSCDGSVETEDDRLYVPTKEDLERWKEEQKAQEEQQREEMLETPLKERIADLEDAICELYELLS